jgi:hypothetical protein
MTARENSAHSLQPFASSVAVLVSSCDSFFDAWHPFAFFFRKFWPDCAFPVYLITNEMQIRSDFIRAIPVGEDRGWASNMKRALQQINATHVLYLQEDYFLDRLVRSEQLAADLDYAIANDLDAFYFRARAQLEPEFEPLNDRFGIVPVNSDGRTRCQLALWKRESLLAVLREGENAWEMESRGSERARAMRIVSYRSRENTPINYLMSAVVRGLWTREALAMCAQNDVRITPHFRATYSDNSLLRKFRRARTRLRLSRALMRARRRGPLDLGRG